MSKSKRNTVDPGSIIDRYGADTARWFILSDNPPDRDMEWTDGGVVGASRFVQRLARLTLDALPALPPAGSSVPGELHPTALELRRTVHRTIQAVTDALETFAFNVAVARIHELANAIGRAAEMGEAPGMGAARREALEMGVRLVAPMMPHLAETLWEKLRPGTGGMVVELPWPEADPALAARQEMTLAVQVQGKVRATVTVPVGADEATVREAAEADENVRRALAGRPIRRVIYVPGKILNLLP